MTKTWFALSPSPAPRSRHTWIGVAVLIVAVSAWPTDADAQAAFTWAEIRAKFETSNPTLQADQRAVDESKASEVTAFLRPNPQFTALFDQIGNNDDNKPFIDLINVYAVSYLRERQHKRELRRDSAKQTTDIAVSSHGNLDRTLLFTLRGAFVQVLMSKAAVSLARENLTFYDQVLTVSRGRLRTGDIAQIDLARLELNRQPLEAAVETADVNLRTAKLQLLLLLDDRTPIDQFDVTGPFDFTEAMPPLDEMRRRAIDARPDLKAALQAAEQAVTNHKLAIANGSTDPTISLDVGFPNISQQYLSYASPLHQYVGVAVSIPLRFSDRNQGEKARTEIDIDRNQKLVTAARAQVLNDVDSAYVTMASTVKLLRPYKDRYLAQAAQVRQIMTLSYERGGAALLDFLQAEQDYRAVQLGYINLVGTYLTVAAQLNMAVGQEVIP